MRSGREAADDAQSGDHTHRSLNAPFNWVNEPKRTSTPVLYQQRITAIAAIELARGWAGNQCTPGMRASHRVPPAASLFRKPPSHPSFLTVAFFFLSLLLDRTERAFAPGTRLLPDREAIDRERARDGYLRRAGQTDRPDVIESRYFIVRAFELRVLALLTRRPFRASPTSLCA